MSNRQQNWTTVIFLIAVLMFGIILPALFPSLVDKVDYIWGAYSAPVLKWLNSIACGLFALQIITFNPNVKHELTPRQIIILLCLMPLTLSMASVPIRTIFGDYPVHDISETVTNLSLCIGFFILRKRLAQII